MNFRLRNNLCRCLRDIEDPLRVIGDAYASVSFCILISGFKHDDARLTLLDIYAALFPGLKVCNSGCVWFLRGKQQDITNRVPRESALKVEVHLNTFAFARHQPGSLVDHFIGVLPLCFLLLDPLFLIKGWHTNFLRFLRRSSEDVIKFAHYVLSSFLGLFRFFFGGLCSCVF